jgi:DNA-binding response OmpR family regulator
MAHDTTLTGYAVLIVEDDFYLADDLRQALEDAGATVLGPAGNARDALRVIDRTPPDCTILDVNLGEGPTFEIAGALKARAIPFIFATGYDASNIPPEFADTLCLEKPLNLRKLVVAVVELRQAVARTGR